MAASTTPGALIKELVPDRPSMAPKFSRPPQAEACDDRLEGSNSPKLTPYAPVSAPRGWLNSRETLCRDIIPTDSRSLQSRHIYQLHPVGCATAQFRASVGDVVFFVTPTPSTRHLPVSLNRLAHVLWKILKVEPTFGRWHSRLRGVSQLRSDT